MRSSVTMMMVGVFGAASLAFACTPPPSKEPVGVSDKAEMAPDESVGSDAGASDNNACAHNPSLLEGKPCAPEGSNCGSPSEDPHQFTNTLVCHGGQWQRSEVPPLALPTK